MKNSLLTDVRGYKPTKGPRCTVCQLDPKVVQEMNEVMRELGPCHKALEESLSKRGVKVTAECIGHHYRKGHHVKA